MSRLAVGSYGFAALLLAIVLAVAVTSDTDPSRFTRDPAVLLDASPTLGLVSYVGILLWTAAAAIALFAAALLRKRGAAREQWTFLGAAGLLTSWLMLDDLFLFHEWLFPVVLGVRQRLLFAGYLLVMAAFLVRFRRIILRTSPLLLAMPLGLFAISVAFDLLPEAWFRSGYVYLWEDAAKLLGIAGWFAYWANASARLVDQPRPPAATF